MVAGHTCECKTVTFLGFVAEHVLVRACSCLSVVRMFAARQAMMCARFHEDGGTDKAVVGDAKPHLLSTACRLGLANKFSPCLDHCLALIIALTPLLPHRLPHRLGLLGCTVTVRSAVRIVFVVGLGVPGGRGRAVWAREGKNEPEPSEAEHTAEAPGQDGPVRDRDTEAAAIADLGYFARDELAW